MRKHEKLNSWRFRDLCQSSFDNNETERITVLNTREIGKEGISESELPPEYCFCFIKLYPNYYSDCYKKNTESDQ